MKVLAVIPIALLITFTFGCKNKPEEGTSTLNALVNFASIGGFKVNICGPKLATSKKPKLLNAHEKLKSVALSTYGAVPSSLHKAVFEQSGEVRVTSNAPVLCSSSMSQSEKNFAGQGNLPKGCWKIENKNVVLVLPEDVKAIRHGMLRLAGYVYSQFLGEASKGKKNGAEFQKRRFNLSEAFKMDMKLKHNGMSPELTKLAASENDFGNFILAESIDSYYCNQETNGSFKKNFPRAYQVFTNGLSSFKGDLGKAFWQ